MVFFFYFEYLINIHLIDLMKLQKFYEVNRFEGGESGFKPVNFSLLLVCARHWSKRHLIHDIIVGKKKKTKKKNTFFFFHFGRHFFW